MSETTNSHVQKAQDAWKKMLDEQTTRMTGLYEEMAKTEAARMTQAAEAVDEMARLTKESFSYMAQLSGEWRKLTMEVAKKAVDMVTPGA